MAKPRVAVHNCLTAGMTTSVRMVDEVMPPIIGTAMRCMTSEPVPVLHMIGMRPATIATTVIILGRTRSTAGTLYRQRRLVENPNVTPVILAGVDPNSALRYLNDVTVVWKATDKLTLTTDVNYIRDDGFNATGYGVAQYATYAINDWLKITGRGEIWRDNNGFFVASFPGNLDFVGIEHGNPLAVAISGGATTYGALTVGLAIKPPVPKQIEGLVIRPEIRYDASLNNTTPFGGGTKSSQWTFASDLIIPFTIK